MSYGRVNKPRFYVDSVNWQTSRGYSKDTAVGYFTPAVSDYTFNDGYNVYQAFDLNPLNVTSINCSGEGDEFILQYDCGVTSDFPITFIALLNHNLDTANVKVSVRSGSSAIEAIGDGTARALVSVVGCEDDSGKVKFPGTGDGDMVATVQDADHRYWGIVIEPVAATFAADVTIGAVLIGNHYTLPNSGDLNVQRDFGFDGVTVRTTDAGKRYGHASWVAGNDGNNYAPFRNQTYWRRPGGRQAYDINFSYIADTDLYPNDMLYIGTATDFYSMVPNRTAGPMLPFIWTPDSTSTTEGDYLFARLMNDFKPQKVANRVWSFKNRIEEEL
jgi:hypothetical protein